MENTIKEINLQLPCESSLKYPDKKFCPKGTDMSSKIYGKNWLDIAFYRTQFGVHRNARNKRLKRMDQVEAYKRLKFPKYFDVEEKIVEYFENEFYLKLRRIFLTIFLLI